MPFNYRQQLLEQLKVAIFRARQVFPNEISQQIHRPGIADKYKLSACQFYLVHEVLTASSSCYSGATLAVADSPSFQIAKLTCSYCAILKANTESCKFRKSGAKPGITLHTYRICAHPLQVIMID